MGTESSVVERSNPRSSSHGGAGRESVVAVLKEMIADIASCEPRESGKDVSVLERSRVVVARKSPRLKKAVKFMTGDIVHWTNRGGPWRASLVISTGIITLVGLSGVSAFLLFFITASVNAAIVALLGSVVAVGAVTALFFAVLTAIYIGALSVAIFIVSTITFFTIATVVMATGWIAFWWIIWQGVKKCMQMVHGSLAFTAITFQSVSAGQAPVTST